MIDKEEMKKQIKQLDKEIKNLKKEKYELEEKYFNLYEIDDIKEKYLNKYYIYRNNSYSCPEEESDYWNVYYKVIEVNDIGKIIALRLQKDKYGDITSKEELIPIDSPNLEEITEKEYIIETSKILKELQERYK